MKGLNKLTLLIILFCWQNILLAQENSIEKIVADLKISKDGVVSPDFFVPYYWTPQLFSGIGYSTWEESSRGIVDGFSESRLSESNQFSRWRMALLSWQSLPNQSMYAFGVDLQYVELKKQEFGYIHFPDNLGGEWVAFDNDVDVAVIMPGISGSAQWSNKSDDFSVRAGGLLTPLSLLIVDQATEFKPIVPNTGSSKDRELQDFSWEIYSDALFKTNLFADIGLSVSYEFLPLDYTLATLEYDSDSSAFSFANSKVEVEQTILTWDLKFIIKYKLVGDAKPTIGFGQRKVTNKDVSSGDSESKTEAVFSIGFGQQF